MNMNTSRRDLLLFAAGLVAVVIVSTTFVSLSFQVEMAKIRNDIRSLEAEATILREESDNDRMLLASALNEIKELRQKAIQGGAGSVSEPQEPQGATVEFTLGTKTVQATRSLAYRFVSVGGETDGEENPALTARVGDTVHIIVINYDEDTTHDFVIKELDVQSPTVEYANEKVTVVFKATEAGEFSYYCSVPGHRQAGMEGVLKVEAA